MAGSTRTTVAAPVHEYPIERLGERPSGGCRPCSLGSSRRSSANPAHIGENCHARSVIVNLPDAITSDLSVAEPAECGRRYELVGRSFRTRVVLVVGDDLRTGGGSLFGMCSSPLATQTPSRHRARKIPWWVRRAEGHVDQDRVAVLSSFGAIVTFSGLKRQLRRAGTQAVPDPGARK